MSLNRASDSIKYIVDNTVDEKIQAELDAYVFAGTGAEWTTLLRAQNNALIMRSRIDDILKNIAEELVTAPVQVPAP